MSIKGQKYDKSLTPQERKAKAREYQKEYYILHRKKYVDRYKANRDDKIAKQKQYYQKHKEERREYQKAYYKRKKEEIEYDIWGWMIDDAE